MYMQNFERRNVNLAAVFLAAAFSGCKPSDPEIATRNENILMEATMVESLARRVSLATQNCRAMVLEALSREDLNGVAEIARTAQVETELLAKQLTQLHEIVVKAQGHPNK